MAKIAHILGDWSRNIGNAFFQLGGQWVIQEVLPDAKIMLINEQPGYPSYWNPKGGNPRNSFDIPSHLDVDYLVLMGPMFRPETEQIWGNSLQKMVANGTKLILLGMGAMSYDEQNITIYRKFLSKYPPFIFISRDHDTYERLGDLARYSYDGIDFGFFMSNVYSPIGFGKRIGEFLALNFDKIPEPSITLYEKGTFSKDENEFSKSFEFNGMQWNIEFPRFRTWFGEQSRYLMFLEGLLFRGNQIDHIGKYGVIRTDHRPHPLLPRKTFRYPNVVVNDTPYIYAEVYGSASLTLSTRVHACVLALAYGQPAMLFSKTPRLRLLDRLGLEGFTERPVVLDQLELQQEKKGILDFLKQHL